MRDATPNRIRPRVVAGVWLGFCTLAALAVAAIELFHVPHTDWRVLAASSALIGPAAKRGARAFVHRRHGHWHAAAHFALGGRLGAATYVVALGAMTGHWLRVPSLVGNLATFTVAAAALGALFTRMGTHDAVDAPASDPAA